MEANIMVNGIPRIMDPQENERRVNAAIAAFLQKYPNSIIEGPTLEFIGKSSQTIAFAITASDFEATKRMHAFFEEKLVQIGFHPTASNEDSAAVLEELLDYLKDSDSAVTYIKDSSGIGRKQEIDVASASHSLPENLKSGLGVAASIAEDMIPFPSETEFSTMSENEEFMTEFLQYFRLGGPFSSKKNLMFKLRKASDPFKNKIVEFIEEECQGLLTEGSKKTNDGAYFFMMIGIVIIGILAALIYMEWQISTVIFVIAFVVGVLFIIFGSFIFSQRKLNRFYLQELPFFQSSKNLSSVESAKPSKEKEPKVQ